MTNQQSPAKNLNRAQQFVDYFHSKVLPSANTVEKTRSKIITVFSIWSVIVLVPSLLFTIALLPKTFSMESIVGFVLPMLFPVVFLIVIPLNLVRKLYGLSAKKRILPVLLGFWGNYSYIPPINIITAIYNVIKEKSGFAGLMAEFQKDKSTEISVNSEILARLLYFENISYDDKIAGKFEDMDIEIAELTTSYTTRDKDNKPTVHTTFKGVVFSAVMNKSFNGMTAISYDSIDRNRLDNPRVHGFSVTENKAQVRSEKVHLEDPEFRKHFEVFSNDQIEARYILTTAFMNRFLKLSQAFDGRIKAIFINKNIYILIDVRKDWFEIPFFKSAVDLNNYRVFINDFTKLLSILDTLKLNQNIGM